MLPSLSRSGKIVVAVWSCIANALTANDSLEQNLQIKLLDASQTWSDVQPFVERRVPAVPPIGTADEWRAISERIRQEVLQKVVFRGEAAQWRKHPLTVEYLETIPLESAGYSLKKLRYEALPGLWIPAVVYEPWSLRNAPEGVRVPVILSVNGHDALGKAAKYKQTRCIHLAKQGCLVLNVEWLGMGQLRSKGVWPRSHESARPLWYERLGTVLPGHGTSSGPVVGAAPRSHSPKVPVRSTRLSTRTCRLKSGPSGFVLDSWKTSTWRRSSSWATYEKSNRG